ncbi:unnamed protein product [Effrenium voratum]|nr:unnamed protein product [Effrenium voratum]
MRRLWLVCLLRALAKRAELDLEVDASASNCRQGQIFGDGVKKASSDPQLHYVKSLSWSPDGQLIAASNKVEIIIWRVAKGQWQVHQLLAVEGVRKVRWSPEGRRLAAACSDGALRIWSYTNGTNGTLKLQHELFSSADEIQPQMRDVAWSPSGEHLVTAVRYSGLCLWQASTGRIEQELFLHCEGEYNSVSWSGERVASACSTEGLTIWVNKSGHFELDNTLGHSNTSLHIEEVAWSHDGASVASGGRDSWIRIWDYKTPERKIQHNGPVSSLAWSPDGAFLLSLGPSSIRIRWVETGSQIELECRPCLSVAWSPDQQHVVSGLRDSKIQIWHASFLTKESWSWVQAFNENTPNSGVAWLDAQHIETSSRDGELAVWEKQGFDWQVVRQRNISPAGLAALAFSPNRQHLVVGLKNTSLQFWTLEDSSGWQLQQTLAGMKLMFRIHWRQDGQQVLVASSKLNTCLIFGASNSGWELQQELPQCKAYACLWLSSAVLAMSNLAAKAVQIWHNVSGKLQVNQSKSCRHLVESLALSSHEQLAAPCNDTVLLRSASGVWRSAEDVWKQAKALRMAWSPDGRMLGAYIKRGERMTMDIWYVNDSLVTKPLANDVTSCTSMAWSQDSTTLAAVFTGGKTRILKGSNLLNPLGFSPSRFGIYFNYSVASICGHPQVQCVEKRSGEITLHLKTFADNIAWDLLPCTARNTRFLNTSFVVEALEISWPTTPQRTLPLSWEVCNALKNFNNLKSLVMSASTMTGIWNCAEGFPRSLVRLIVTNATNASMPYSSFKQLLDWAQHLVELDLSGMMVSWLGGLPGPKMKLARFVNSNVVDFQGMRYQVSKHGGACQPCQRQEYYPDYSVSHLISCKKCGANQDTQGEGAQTRSECFCSAGYVMKASYCALCTDLPGGYALNCTTPNLTLRSAPVKDGYWRQGAQAPLSCDRFARFALNGCHGRKPGEMCRVGHEGPKCRVCRANFFQRSGHCQRCTTEQLKAYAKPIASVVVLMVVLAAGAGYFFSRPKTYRSDLLQPPGPWDALQPYLVRELLAAVQVYQLFAVLSKLVPKSAERIEAKPLTFVEMDLSPITDSMHLDCVLGFGNARILKSLTEPLVPCCILALLYVVLRLTKEDGEERLKAWATAQMQVINLLLVSTVTSLMTVAECDTDFRPPIMVSAPEVGCDTTTFHSMLAFAVFLGLSYAAYVATLVSSSIRRFQEKACHMWHVPTVKYQSMETGAFKVSLSSEGPGYTDPTVRSALLDAAQVRAQQVLSTTWPMVTVWISSEDSPKDERVVRFSSEQLGAEELVTALSTLQKAQGKHARSGMKFQSLAVRCLLLSYERANQEGTLRGIDIFGKFAPDCFHFVLLLKVGFVLVTYVPYLPGHQAQGAVGSFICCIMCLSLLLQPFSRPSEGATLTYGLAALGLAFLMLMLSETHLKLGQEDLTVALQVSRLLLLIPLGRLLLPTMCLNQEMRKKNQDVMQEQALLEVSWQHVARQRRQPFRVKSAVKLQPEDHLLQVGTLVLPLRTCGQDLEE